MAFSMRLKCWGKGTRKNLKKTDEQDLKVMCLRNRLEIQHRPGTGSEICTWPFIWSLYCWLKPHRNCLSARVARFLGKGNGYRRMTYAKYTRIGLKISGDIFEGVMNSNFIFLVCVSECLQHCHGWILTHHVMMTASFLMITMIPTTLPKHC